MLVTPKVIQHEHAELHTELAKAIKLPGKTGKAAKKVAELLEPHFEKEEAFAMPVLSVLGKEKAAYAPEVLAMTTELETEMPKMLVEHKEIVAALAELKSAAAEEGHPEIVTFAGQLKHHAIMEEEVLYPAALLVGKYLSR